MEKTDITINSRTSLTVGELIEILQSKGNDDLPVFLYDCGNAIPLGIYEEDVDLLIEDRVDINFET